MRKTVTALDKLKKMMDAIERGHFELIECEAVAIKSEPGQYTVTVLLERLVAERKSNKNVVRQRKVRELIFDDEDLS